MQTKGHYPPVYSHNYRDRDPKFPAGFRLIQSGQFLYGPLLVIRRET